MRALQKLGTDFLLRPHWSKSTQGPPQMKVLPGPEGKDTSLQWEETVHVHVHRNEEQQAEAGSVFPSFILLSFSTFETLLLLLRSERSRPDAERWSRLAKTAVNQRLHLPAAAAAAAAPGRMQTCLFFFNSPYLCCVPSPRSPPPSRCV